jgi:hypothetical protein
MFLCAFILYSGQEVCTQSLPDTVGTRTPDVWALGMNYLQAKNLKSGGLYEFTIVDFSSDSTVEYSFAPFVAGSLANIDGRQRYSFRGPINLALVGIDALATRYLLGSHMSPFESPLRYALFAPNSSVNVRMRGALKLTLATNTEYIVYRLHDGERGILFTPQVGFTLSGGPSSEEFNGIILTVGATRFWSFDRSDRPFQFAFHIGFILTDSPGG